MDGFVLSRVFWIWLVCDLILLLVVANKFGGFGCFGFGFGGFDGFCGFVLKRGVWVGICQDFSCFWYFELIFLGWGGFLGFNGFGVLLLILLVLRVWLIWVFPDFGCFDVLWWF